VDGDDAASQLFHDAGRRGAGGGAGKNGESEQEKAEKAGHRERGVESAAGGARKGEAAVVEDGVEPFVDGGAGAPVAANARERRRMSEGRDGWRRPVGVDAGEERSCELVSDTGW
jgi:hypothetical protein